MAIAFASDLARPVARRILEQVFDFRVTTRKPRPLGFKLGPRIDFRTVADDASGGLFAEVGRSASIVYVSSEGQAGAIAPNLAAAVAMIVELPYWRDLLKFSGGGRLKEMERARALLEAEVREDVPDLREQQAKLRKALKLPPPANPVVALHDAVEATPSECAVFAASGERFDSLFGSFTTKSNPSWQRR